MVVLRCSPQPNSMGIDPRDRQCIAFYEKMKELGMVRATTTSLLGSHC